MRMAVAKRMRRKRCGGTRRRGTSIGVLRRLGRSTVMVGTVRMRLERLGLKNCL